MGFCGVFPAGVLGRLFSVKTALCVPEGSSKRVFLEGGKKSLLFFRQSKLFCYRRWFFCVSTTD